jgi:hypothetical protein
MEEKEQIMHSIVANMNKHFSFLNLYHGGGSVKGTKQQTLSRQICRRRREGRKSSGPVQ